MELSRVRHHAISSSVEISSGTHPLISGTEQGIYQLRKAIAWHSAFAADVGVRLLS